MSNIIYSEEQIQGQTQESVETSEDKALTNLIKDCADNTKLNNVEYIKDFRPVDQLPYMEPQINDDNIFDSVFSSWEDANAVASEMQRVSHPGTIYFVVKEFNKYKIDKFVLKTLDGNNVNIGDTLYDTMYNSYTVESIEVQDNKMMVQLLNINNGNTFYIDAETIYKKFITDKMRSVKSIKLAKTLLNGSIILLILGAGLGVLNDYYSVNGMNTVLYIGAGIMCFSSVLPIAIKNDYYKVDKKYKRFIDKALIINSDIEESK